MNSDNGRASRRRVVIIGRAAILAIVATEEALRSAQVDAKAIILDDRLGSIPQLEPIG